MELNNEQRLFVSTDSPRLLLEAPAGSGKTHTVSERVKRLARDGKKVLVVCYTHSAKDTITERLRRAGLRTPVRTVVSLAYEALSRLSDEPLEVGDGSEPALDVCVRTPVSVGQLLNLEALIQNGAPLPPDTHAVVLEVFKKYQEAKIRRHYFSYVDVVLGAVGLTLEHWDEVIVDEAQDLTPSQLEFLLGLDADSYTLVGDSAQAIFSFAGVDPELFSKLKKSGWDRLSLTTTYRVPENLLPVVNAVRDEPLTAVRPGGRVDVIEGSYKTARRDLSKLLEPGDVVLGTAKTQLNRISSWMGVDRPELMVSNSWEEDSATIADAVRFSTIHKAKGGEWNRVFLLDVTANGLYQRMGDSEDVRKKLFYVGASRSLDDLFLYSIDEELPWGLTL